MARRAALPVFLGLLCALFTGLGYWQLERRTWKLDLIEQIEQQLRRTPVPAPGPPGWNTLGKRDAYRPVRLTGRYLHDRETRVQAMTEHGSGYWLLTPLRSERGFTVLVNRGFVDFEHKAPNARAGSNAPGRVEITGLLRLTEPDGRLFQDNRPDEGRWYSRDVQAIGRQQRLDADQLAPYFVDADASPPNASWPIGGLTVTRLRNAHLGYALTWFSLAGLCLLGLMIVLRQARHDRP